MSRILTTGVTTMVDSALSSVTNVGAGATTFLPVVSQRGPLAPVELSNIATYQALYGVRHNGYEPSYDAVEALTVGSGPTARVVTVRVVGPAATPATKDFNGSGSQPAVTVNAANPGTWGNSIKLAVTDEAGNKIVKVTHGDQVVHQWQVDNAQHLADLAVNSPVITVTVKPGKGGEKLADIGATALAGGKDDDSNITLEHVKKALGLVDESWGGGQLIAPLWQTTAAHRALLDLAEKTNRVALLDAPYADKADTAKATEWAQLRNDVSQHFTDGRNVSWRGALFPMWVQLRPWGTGQGIKRVVPGSVFAAAVIAQNAGRITPNEQPIETNGYPAGSIFTEPVVKMTLSELDELSVKTKANLPFADYNGLRLYGFTSVSASAPWTQFNRGRFACTLSAEVSDRTRFIVGRLDNEANRVLLRDLIASAIADHIEVGNLVPLSPEEPFKLETGTDPAQPSRVTVDVEVKFAHAIQAVVINVTNRAN